jgi:hypothetical protein
MYLGAISNGSIEASQSKDYMRLLGALGDDMRTTFRAEATDLAGRRLVSG